MNPEYGEKSQTAVVGLNVLGQQIKVEIPVPEGYASPAALLPLFQGLADIIVDVSVETAKKQGANLSCKKGCGACCRQLSPITIAEAHRLRDIIQTMTEPTRTDIRNRFEAAEKRLTEAGLLESLSHISDMTHDQRQELGKSYFALGIPCPFLERESCSIHSDRPIICREYIVSSTPINCETPSAATITKIPVPPAVSQAVAKISARENTKPYYIPLSLILSDKILVEDMRPVHAATAIEAIFHSMRKTDRA